MDIEAIRKKMNSYLNSVSPDMIVKEFEKRGYNLETCLNTPELEYTEYHSTYAHPLGNNGTFKTTEKSNPKKLLFFVKYFNRFTYANLN